MTWAFNNRDDLDNLGNAQEEAMRTWYRENPTAFLDRYTKLAEAHARRGRSRSQRPKEVKGHPKTPQAGTDLPGERDPCSLPVSAGASASEKLSHEALGELIRQSQKDFREFQESHGK
jgi:hypothetical protein